MARPFSLLRGEFTALDLTQEDVAEALGMEPPVLSKRMNNRIPWKLGEMYKVMDLIQQPYHKMHLYFPRDGINEPKEKRRRGAA